MPNITSNNVTNLISAITNNMPTVVVTVNGTWGGATAVLGYINSNGDTVSLTDGSFTADFQKEVSIPRRKLVLTTSGGTGISLYAEAIS